MGRPLALLLAAFLAAPPAADASAPGGKGLVMRLRGAASTESGYRPLAEGLVSLLRRPGLTLPAGLDARPDPSALAGSIESSCLGRPTFAYPRSRIIVATTLDESTGDEESDYFLECPAPAGSTSYFRVLAGQGEILYARAVIKAPPAAADAPIGPGAPNQTVVEEMIRAVLAGGADQRANPFELARARRELALKAQKLGAGDYAAVLAYAAFRLFGTSKDDASRLALDLTGRASAAGGSPPANPGDAFADLLRNGIEPADPAPHDGPINPGAFSNGVSTGNGGTFVLIWGVDF